MKNLYKLLKQKGFTVLAARVRGPYANPDAIHDEGIDLYFSTDTVKVRVSMPDALSAPINRFRITRNTTEQDEEEVQSYKQEILEETHQRMVKVREIFVQLIDGLVTDAANQYNEKVEKKQK